LPEQENTEYNRPKKEEAMINGITGKPLRTLCAILLALMLTAGLLFSLSACSNPAADAVEQSSANAETTASESSTNTPAGPVTFTDDLGNSVTVENPRRVVACMGSFAGAWELAGGTLAGA
jgi:hypothetical protein